MATDQKTVDFILEQVSRAGSVTAKKMFGEYGLYCDGKLFGLVCDDQLFIKPTIAGLVVGGRLQEGSPYPDARPQLIVPSELWDDSDWLTELVRVTVAAVPAPSPKKPAAKRGRK